MRTTCKSLGWAPLPCLTGVSRAGPGILDAFGKTSDLQTYSSKDQCPLKCMVLSPGGQAELMGSHYMGREENWVTFTCCITRPVVLEGLIRDQFGQISSWTHTLL